MPFPIDSQAVKSLALIFLSIVLLPLDTFVLAATLLYRTLSGSKLLWRRESIQRDLTFRPRKILVTGVGMTKGLVLARAFYIEGHDVVGADFEPRGAMVCGRVSKSLCAFHRLPQPSSTGSASYIKALKDIVRRERIELWVSCSGVVSAVDDGKAKEVIESETNCVAIQFNAATTEMLHEKDSFMRHVSDLGLQIPETHTVTSFEDAWDLLQAAPGNRRYILKPIGVDDASRADMTLLPLKSMTKTSEHVAKLEISKNKPYILQQYVKGEEYCTQALVIRGKAVLFVACPSAELLMHYEALPANSALSQKMLEFTQKLAANGGSDFTGHLSFDFLVEGDDKTGLYPIECNPRCHTAIVLFREHTEAIADAYLSALEPKSVTSNSQGPVVPKHPDKYYWLGHDLVALFLYPLFRFCTFTSTLDTCFVGAMQFLAHILFWKDGTFEIFDPLPWWWLYHVYWPVQFFNSIYYSQHWSRVNVSTTKMFKC